MATLPAPPANDVVGAGAGAGAGIGASLGLISAPLATPPQRPTTATVTPNDPLYAQAIAEAKAALQAQTNPLLQQQQASDAYYAQRQQDALGAYEALSKLLSQLNIGGQIQGAYQTSAQDQSLIAQGEAHGMSDALNGSASGINALLDKIGAPAGQQVGGNIPAAGSALAGIYGALPAQSWEQAGAAQAAAADQLPGIALLQGGEEYKNLGAQAVTAHTSFDNQIAQLAANLPGDVQTNYHALQQYALDNAKFAETVKNDNFNQAYKMGQQAIAKYNAQTNAYYKGVSAQQRGQSLALQAQKFSRSIFQQNREYALQLQRLGISSARLQMSIASNEYKLAHGGYTAGQIAKFNTKLDALAANPPKNAALRTYPNFIAAALKKGVPFSTAMAYANKLFPADQQDLGPLATLPSVAQDWQGALNAAGTTAGAANSRITGRTLGTSPNGVPITFSVSSKLSVKGNAQVQGIMQLASEYLGTPYAWGGESPTGFDCSGLAQYIYAKEGIQIPRTTYDQWGQGLPVPKSQLQAGDLVFFKGSDSRNGLPGHVGIYIGNGLMVNAPHTGTVVQVSRVNSFGGYMGARRYVH